MRRAIVELEDHHTDLFGESFARGCSVEDAELEASMRLGTDDALTEEIIVRQELKSWSHRWPWLAYGVTPTVAYIVAVIAIPAANAWQPLWWLNHPVRLFSTYGVPLLVAGACCVLGGRRRAASRWPMIGAVIVAMIGAAFQLSACVYGPNAQHAFCLRSAIPPFPGFSGTLLRAAATAALTLGPYLWSRRRMATAQH